MNKDRQRENENKQKATRVEDSNWWSTALVSVPSNWLVCLSFVLQSVFSSSQSWGILTDVPWSVCVKSVNWVARLLLQACNDYPYARTIPFRPVYSNSHLVVVCLRDRLCHPSSSSVSSIITAPGVSIKSSWPKARGDRQRFADQTCLMSKSVKEQQLQQQFRID